MTNIRSKLTSYLQYQRDIGVDTLVFERGSAVKTLLAGITRTVNKYDGVTSSTSTPLTSVKSMTSTTSTSTPKGVASGGASDPLSKLAKLRPVDTLDIRKFERLAPPRPFAPVNSAKREKLAVLYREALNCAGCDLSKSRDKVIFGSGSADGRVFVVGGAPDSCDEASGLPFQGDIGELLDKILSKMGLDRKKDIFATYAQKCRRREIQEESPEYAAACRTLLDRQIEIIQPKVILVFGRLPANFILENGDDIEQLRGMYHIYKGIPLVATYGLPVLLKDTQYRADAWEDVKKAMSYATN